MNKNILVTGSHRSGSTWTGNVIAKAQNVRYIHEPFNIGIHRKNHKSPFNYWFECLIDSATKNQKKASYYIDSFYKVFHRNNLKRLLTLRSLKGLYHYFADMKRRITDRTIIKDPIAIMSTEWIYMNYNIDIVVLIRHPAAFIASLKVKDWQFDFNNYLNQPVLMNTYLKEYESVIEDFSKNKRDIIDQGILLWNTIHDTIAYYQERYKNDWYFVKHENLSINPLAEFSEMFSKLNLTLDSNVANYIKESTSGSEQSAFKRNSVDNIKNWKNRLTDDEIKRIKIGTGDVWKKFYTEKDW
ncbi:sulfotransferase domain-containing protein [Marivirga sp.]|uniref:sulfotransferase domain-containing protein n=1 Tax=Marivirga sp. TaxID=2018662 RepID=UPI0025FB0D6C|nr:sulfotransferase domain-containing protein [Marivirga sp.]